MPVFPLSEFVMSRVVFAAALALVAAPLMAQAPAGAKIAYIRSQAVLESAPGRVEAEAALEKEYQALADSARRMEEAFNRQVQDFQKAAPAMTEKLRTTRDSALRARQAELQILQQSMQRGFQQRQGEMMQPITAQIRLALEDMRAAEGYAIIFDADAAQGGAIVASDKNLDLTDRVIAKLRTMPKPSLPIATKAPAVPAAGGAAPATPASPPATAPATAGAAPKPSTGPVAQPTGVQRPKPPAR
jgi:outer membrane protein